jgi:hypothetical protein
MIELIDNEKEIQGGESGHCKFYNDDPCMWLVKKEDMLSYESDKYGHLPTEDWPPNNVCRKTIYQQMTLFINERPLGKGVCKELPKCVVYGCRESLSSPMFMGFKEK